MVLRIDETDALNRLAQDFIAEPALVVVRPTRTRRCEVETHWTA